MSDKPLKFTAYDWFNTEDFVPMFGMRAKMSKGPPRPVARDGKALLYLDKAERDAELVRLNSELASRRSAVTVPH